MTGTHLLCYVRRDELTSWKLDSIERGRPNHPILAYGSNDRTFAQYAKKGNTLWIIGADAKFPLTLEARIKISDRIPRDGDWKCSVRGSADGCTFFGLNDVSTTVMQLVFQNSKAFWSLQTRHRIRTWQARFGCSFQAPRRIAPRDEKTGRHVSLGALPLEQLASQLLARSIFISWKHSDHDHDQQRISFLRSLTAELCRLGFAVWWDETALTDSDTINEYAPSTRDDMMRWLLQQGLSQASVVLGIWTDRYGRQSDSSRRNWTRDEWQVGGKLGRLALIYGKHDDRKPNLADPDQLIHIPERPDAVHAPMVAHRLSRAFDVLIKASRHRSR